MVRGRWGGWGSTRFIVSVVSMATLLASCTETRGPLGLQCERNSQCQSPLVCRLTRCRTECATQRDCPLGSLCVVDGDGVGSCRLDDEASCVRASDCPAPLACLGGACTNTCAEDRDCAPGASCDPDTLGCVDIAESVCAYDSDCMMLSCTMDRRCRDECRKDVDCRHGTTCEMGHCTPVLDPQMDAGGLDAGGLDAAMTDAGGSDAGESDAGGSDAGGSDAGGSDAGNPGADAGAVVGPSCTMESDCPSPANTRTDCVDGQCVITQCTAYMVDCDGDYATGCEVHPPTDVNNCVTCGTVCDPGQVCAGGCVDGSVAELELGRHMGCVRFTSGHVVCWGTNNVGQLGDGTPAFVAANRPAPALVAGLSDATQLVVGYHANGNGDESHACALRAGGSVVCWGSNRSGEVGVAASPQERAPVAVAGISDAVELAAGDQFTCARHADGTVSCWGEQLGGRLGNGMFLPEAMPPTLISGLSGVSGLVSTSGWFACAEVAPSDYRCWGAANGGLGDGTTNASATPVAATALLPLGMTGLRGSSRTMFGVDSTGHARCWGNAEVGLCGPTDAVNVASPYQYASAGGIAQVEGGEDTAMARLDNGEIRCWGENGFGQCGLGRIEDPIRLPEGSPIITDATDIAVGGSHTCIVRASGGVWCAGLNGFAALGTGTFEPGSTSPLFVRVQGIP